MGAEKRTIGSQRRRRCVVAKAATAARGHPATEQLGGSYMQSGDSCVTEDEPNSKHGYIHVACVSTNNHCAQCDQAHSFPDGWQACRIVLSLVKCSLATQHIRLVTCVCVCADQVIRAVVVVPTQLTSYPFAGVRHVMRCIMPSTLDSSAHGWCEAHLLESCQLHALAATSTCRLFE